MLVIPLETLKINQSGRIVDFSGSEAWRHRMEELGFRIGSVVSLIKSGEPCIVALGQTRMSLRCDAGQMILVEVLE
jgi:Fe2+ transport system protein FeoA